MKLRRPSQSDLPVLAELNHQLILDEGHRNPMTVPELESRMRSWLAGEYESRLFELDNSTIGYVLHRQDSAEVYVRQFFIQREFRRQGYGQLAFEQLVEQLWSNRRIRLDVLVGNQGGMAFWRSLGFEDYCITMERSPG